MKSDKCKTISPSTPPLTKRSGHRKRRKPTDSPPIEVDLTDMSSKRIKRSSVEVRDNDTKMQVNLRPKVMVDSSISPITPSRSSYCDRRGDHCCPRVLDSGSSCLNLESNKCKIINPATPPLTNCSDRRTHREVWALAPIKVDDHTSNERIRRSCVKVRDNKKLATNMQLKLRPEVMMDYLVSPVTPSPSSSGGQGGDGDPSCRRVLDFGSSSHVHTKLMTIKTTGGYTFSRQVSVVCNEKEEEEWWKKERELFEQRALSFIASMRLVQGPRPFMGWKGSVVDSVVGVFLTQNAADSSSSSAFMSLAAKYPKKINVADGQNENHTEHALDWNAVRNATRADISHAIQGRGMNKRIALRIKKFLDGIHNHTSGLYDLEWLRNATPEEAKDLFMKVYGLGLKSMGCLRLLTLRQHAFPVDRHLSRILVRLGWVPVNKLPQGVLIHQLEEYPMMNQVQEYLSDRLSNLDVETLHELHYQMITFGKVYCTKKKPNCNSCPLKKDCMHFASASGKGRPNWKNTCVPVIPGGIIGQPTPVSIPSPELEDIEDLCLDRKVEEMFSPAHKVAGRLKTKHRVYELYDSHPLLQELDKRDPDDKHPYLLAVRRPGEIILNPVKEECCSLKSSDSAQKEETVYGTLLVPCRTATRGSFPLDGTFFQINEVFADDESSENQLVVPAKSLLDLNTKTLYCGTSISSICEGMSTKEIQECFLKGYVCIRGFNMKTREPRPMHEQFHRALTTTVKSSRKGKLKDHVDLQF